MNNRRAGCPYSGCGIAFAALTCLLLPVANAQSDVDPDAVRSCQRVADRSLRLDCYDRAFPPEVESEESAEALESAEFVEPVHGDDAPRQRRERVATVAETGSTARIVEVQMPSLGTTLFLAADGRTFVRENATTVIRWPDTPFDAEIHTGLFGTSTFLQLPGGSRRVRVVVRD